MTIWRAAEALAIGVAVFVGGTMAAVGAMWLLSRIARRFGTDPTPMGTTTQTQGIRSQQEADAIRARAEVRHARAEEHHAEGRAIDSGEPPHAIKLVGRR